MKKVTAILLGALIVSSAALAQTNQVLSKNAVGYIKISLPASNRLALVSNPFVPLGASDNLITNLFAPIANNTTISIWNENTLVYDNYSRNNRGSWVGTGVTTARFNRADAAFIRSSATGTIFFMGEVPDATTAPTSTQTRINGITMFGYPYPVEVLVTNSPVGLNLPNGGSISLWNSASNSYEVVSKNTRGSWVGAVGKTIAPGAGMVVRVTNNPSAVITTTKPYTWP